MDEVKKLGVIAFIPKNIFQSINYICLFTEKHLLVIENNDVADYLETNNKKSFLERIKEAFSEKEVNYNFSEEKMLESKLVKIYNRSNTEDISFSTLNNQLRFYSTEESDMKVFNFDYEQEEIIIFLRKIFGLTDENIS